MEKETERDRRRRRRRREFPSVKLRFSYLTLFHSSPLPPSSPPPRPPLSNLIEISDANENLHPHLCQPAVPVPPFLLTCGSQNSQISSLLSSPLLSVLLCTKLQHPGLITASSLLPPPPPFKSMQEGSFTVSLSLLLLLFRPQLKSP